MRLTVDLHSHSGASGGVGDVSLETVAATMALKGIDVFGTGDAFHAGWRGHLEEALEPAAEGLYRLRGGVVNPAARFLIQSEIILTCPVPSGGRKGVHLVVLLPSTGAAREAARCLEGWGAKLGIGRPFLPCASSAEVAERLFALQAIDDGIEFVPAHVLTPQGIYGSNHPVERLADVFGEAETLIRAVETGLSADPEVLALIPELDGRTLLSNSDCHSGALHRVGREYTVLEVATADYAGILAAVRTGAVALTAEFTPAEGRYFLTGHRAGKRGHTDGSYCFFSPDRVPEGNVCPVCGKGLTVGVLQRALELGRLQGERRTLETARPRQRFIRLLPLVEVLAAALGIRNPAAKKVRARYDRLVAGAGGETAFWELSESACERLLDELGEEAVSRAVRHVRAGAYTFRPLGYDGLYGELILGERGDWFGHEVVERRGPQRGLL